MKKTNKKQWNQKVSEYVGAGHPDRIADRIAKVFNDRATTSATEVIVNRNGVYISGENIILKQEMIWWLL